MRKYKFPLLLLLVLAANSIYAQQAWEKMLKLYSGSNSYSMDFIVNIQVNGEDQPVNYKGSIRCSGGNYYSAVQGIVTVYGPRYSILVYEKEKTMYYGKVDADTKKNLGLDQRKFADSLLKKSARPVLKKKNGDEEIYTYTMKEGVYAAIDYHVSASTGYLTKVVYNYRQSEDVAYKQASITYSSVSVNQPIADSWFSEKYYFTIRNHKATGAGKYTGFTVIEQESLIPQE